MAAAGWGVITAAPSMEAMGISVPDILRGLPPAKVLRLEPISVPSVESPIRLPPASARSAALLWRAAHVLDAV